MQTHTIARDGARALRFCGQLIAEESSRSHRGARQSRWTEYRLYRMADGRLILERRYMTCWQGESGSQGATVHEDEEALIQHLESQDGGISALAQDLLDTAEIEAVETI